MKVEDIMSTEIVSVTMDDPLRVVKEIFDNARFHHLLVVDDGAVTGVVSDRDLLKAISPHVGTLSETSRDTATLNKKVHQVMTRKPITLRAEAAIADAIAVFDEHRVSCIPVVDYRMRPLGILSWRDVLAAVAASYRQS